MGVCNPCYVMVPKYSDGFPAMETIYPALKNLNSTARRNMLSHRSRAKMDVIRSLMPAIYALKQNKIQQHWVVDLVRKI